MDIQIENVGGVCPVQGDGTIDGERFYFRYRHDDAQLHVGPPDPDNPGMPADRLYAEIRSVFNDGGDRGWLTDDEATELIHRLAGQLRPVEEYAGGTYADRLAAQVAALVERMNHHQQSTGE